MADTNKKVISIEMKKKISTIWKGPARCKTLHKINLAGGGDSGSVDWIEERFSWFFPPVSIFGLCFRLVIALEREKMTQNMVSSPRFSNFKLVNAQRAVHHAIYSMSLKNFVDMRYNLNLLFLYQLRCMLMSTKFSRFFIRAGGQGLRLHEVTIY